MMSKDQLSPNYLALYGLRESAFSQEHDDRFFFLDTDQARRLSLLHNLIQDPNLFLHVKGITGVGKSSLINRFVNIGEEDWRFSFFSANAMMNSEQLHFNISAGFGLSGLDNNENLKATCLKNISSLVSSGVIPILIIDDAQELPIDTLKSVFELVNRWDKNHPKLRIILISDIQFDKVLDSDKIKSIRKIISHELEIEPLTEEQIERYIYFRLSVAGLDGGNPISPDACSIILKKSKGVPQKINSLCHIALRDGMEKMSMKEFFDDHSFNFPFRKYLITASLMAIFIGVMFSVIEPYDFNGSENRLTINNKLRVSVPVNSAISSTSIIANLQNKKIKPQEAIEAQKKNIVGSLKIKRIRTYNFSKFKDRFNKKITRTNLYAIYSISKLQIKKNKITVSSNNLSKYDINKLTTITSKNFPKITSLLPKIMNSENNEKIINIHGVRLGMNSKISIYGKNGVIQIQKDKINYISDTQISLKLIPGQFQGKNWIVVTDPEKGKSNSKLLEVINNYDISLEKPGAKLMHDKQWILAQNSDLYILHVLGSKHKEDIVDFTQYENITGQFAVFETNRNGTEWYHLILGTYKDRDAAKLAIQKFPKETTKPWIRPIKDIQKAIKKLNQNSL